jgi:hypothetical protein
MRGVHPVWAAAWLRPIASPGTVTVPCKWSIGLMLHYGHTIAACPHVLQTLNVLPAHTSFRPMMALTSSAFKTCACALETCKPNCIDFSLCLRPAAHKKPQGMWWRHRSPPDREAGSRAKGHVALRSPPLQGGRIWSCRTCGALEPSLVERQDLELQDT